MGDIIFEVKRNIQILTLNRPTKKNSITDEMKRKITETLESCAKNPEINVLVITGFGDFFSGGTNLSVDKDKEFNIDSLTATFGALVIALINFPKILVAYVNGPAIGMACTMLGLCDFIYADPSATFLTPFVSLGICAEAASSFTFTLNMGRAQASRMLLLGEKLTAQEALNAGLITQILSPTEVWQKIEKIAKLPPSAVASSKALMLKNFKNNLHESNERELKLLAERFFSEEFLSTVMKFSKRSRL